MFACLICATFFVIQISLIFIDENQDFGDDIGFILIKFESIKIVWLRGKFAGLYSL